MGVDDGNGEGDDFPSSSIIAKDGGGVHVMIWDLESDYWLILFGLCVFCWDEGEVVLFVYSCCVVCVCVCVHKEGCVVLGFFSTFFFVGGTTP